MRSHVRWYAVLVFASGVGLPSAVEAQWSIAAYLGNAWTSNGTLHVTSPGRDTDVTLRSVPYRDQSFRSPIYYGVRLTHLLRRAPRLGVEGEFIHLKAITDPAAVVPADGRVNRALSTGPLMLGTVLPHFEMSHGLNFILANALVRLPISREPRPLSRVTLTMRGGIGPTLPHVEAKVDDGEVSHYRLGGVAYHAAAGVEGHMWKGLLFASDLKWTATHQRHTVGGSAIGGWFRTWHLVAGVGWQLTNAPARSGASPGRRHTHSARAFRTQFRHR